MQAEGADDIGFANAILKYAENELCVDMAHVFLTGFSTGAFLSYTLACSNPKAYAGIGVNAGSIGREHIDECKSAKGAVPVIGFHSLADPTVPWNGLQHKISLCIYFHTHTLTHSHTHTYICVCLFVCGGLGVNEIRG